jgi:hypothetical protein
MLSGRGSQLSCVDEQYHGWWFDDDKISTVYSGKGGIWHIQCSEVVHLLVSFSIVQRAIDELAWGA